MTTINWRLLLCKLGHHAPDRRKAAWDGLHYQSACLGCGAPLYRKAHRRWRKINS